MLLRPMAARDGAWTRVSTSWYDAHYISLRIKAAAFENGNAYMMVTPSDRNNTVAGEGKLLAISPDGRVAWSKDIEFLNRGTLATANGLLVAFHNYNMSVFDSRSGTLLWSISNVDSPVADQDGKHIPHQGPRREQPGQRPPGSGVIRLERQSALEQSAVRTRDRQAGL